MKKVAVPVKGNNMIDDHFGHCEYYNVYNISEKNEITDVQTIKAAQGCGCKSNIARVLADLGVSVMLAGGIGEGAVNVLSLSGIEVIRGCSGNAIENVKKYITGSITDSGETCREHQHHMDGGHACNN